MEKTTVAKGVVSKTPLVPPAKPTPSAAALERCDQRRQVVVDMQTKSFAATGTISRDGYTLDTITRRSNGNTNILPLSAAEQIELSSLYAGLAAQAANAAEFLKG